jgi:hypothetical protein
VAVITEPPVPTGLAAALAGSGAARVIAGAETVRAVGEEVTLSARAEIEAVPARRPVMATVASPLSLVVAVAGVTVATEVGLTVNTTVVAAAGLPPAFRTVAFMEAPVDPAVIVTGAGWLRVTWGWPCWGGGVIVPPLAGGLALRAGGLLEFSDPQPGSAAHTNTAAEISRRELDRRGR